VFVKSISSGGIVHGLFCLNVVVYGTGRVCLGVIHRVDFNYKAFLHLESIISLQVITQVMESRGLGYPSIDSTLDR
jgi:hypothetical protein